MGRERELNHRLAEVDAVVQDLAFTVSDLHQEVQRAKDGYLGQKQALEQECAAIRQLLGEVSPERAQEADARLLALNQDFSALQQKLDGVKGSFEHDMGAYSRQMLATASSDLEIYAVSIKTQLDGMYQEFTKNA